MIKKFTSVVLLLAGLITVSACDKEESKPVSNIVNLSATINGSQEVAPNNSTATGSMTGTYDKTTGKLTYTVTYQGITPSAGHIHEGAVGTNGGVIVTFPSMTSPINGTATLTEEDAKKLLANATYVNFHTTAYNGGEIRGNISVK
jgi:hypothetical protein